MKRDKKPCSPACGVSRRHIVKGLAAGLGVASFQFRQSSLADYGQSDPTAKISHAIPTEKNLTDSWLESLYRRGRPTSYSSWNQQRFIGMPVGGIGTGTVYIGGDGKLWCWDIFNHHHEGVVPSATTQSEYVNPHGGRLRERDGANFVYPPEQQSPWNFEQGFAVQIAGENGYERRTIDRRGFRHIRFEGQAPIAKVTYDDPSIPLVVQLEALTPHIPLDEGRSSYPATIMRYTLNNTGAEPLFLSFECWAENPVLAQNSHRSDGKLLNSTFSLGQCVGIFLSCETDGPTPLGHAAIDSLPDYGSLAILCCDKGAKATANSFFSPPNREISREYRTSVWLPAVAGISRDFELGPGESRDFTFVLAWYFPNVRLPVTTPDRREVFPPVRTQRWYATQFADAKGVASAVAGDKDDLVQLTRLWHEQWYDSTLPHWVLERCLIPGNALQTNTSYRFEDGRFWAWEGVGCCPGTCTHVWHYAQTVGRLFPALERNLRERTDYGVALQPDGAIDFRAEYNDTEATDGQAGVILRTYRDHLTNRDNEFLLSLWPKVKRAVEFLIRHDAGEGEPDGILEGRQPNTLDAEWFGKIPSMVSLYLAALRAGEEMAQVMGDTMFANRCRQIYLLGKENILKLFDGERGFFIQEEDPVHGDALGIGRGCYIDQVIGQWWAYQLGLGRLYNGKRIRKALSSLWKYNFCPDMGKLRDSIDNPSLRGRPYALSGDAGLVICTWPKGGGKADWERRWQFGYFNECMTGFEYQVASHMVWESDEQPDLLEKGLAITRAIHDRYSGGLRNPYNEIECSDHYARAMSSYSVFLALCGFEYDGPRKHIGFKPRLTRRQQFRAAFTAAEGWGRFSQIVQGKRLHASIFLAYGQLALSTIGLRLPNSLASYGVKVSIGSARLIRDGQDAIIEFGEPVKIERNETLSITIA